MRFKEFYNEVIATTTTSMGGAAAQYSDKVGGLQKRKIDGTGNPEKRCKKCKKLLKNCKCKKEI
jgi:hypothetical protein